MMILTKDARIQYQKILAYICPTQGTKIEFEVELIGKLIEAREQK